MKLVEARVVGGGARSGTWNQIKADVLNVPYQRLKGNEFGAWGAAMIAGKAAGLINDLAAHAEETALLNGESIPSVKRKPRNLYTLDRKIHRVGTNTESFFYK